MIDNLVTYIEMKIVRISLWKMVRDYFFFIGWNYGESFFFFFLEGNYGER